MAEVPNKPHFKYLGLSASDGKPLYQHLSGGTPAGDWAGVRWRTIKESIPDDLQPYGRGAANAPTGAGGLANPVAAGTWANPTLSPAAAAQRAALQAEVQAELSGLGWNKGESSFERMQRENAGRAGPRPGGVGEVSVPSQGKFAFQQRMRAALSASQQVPESPTKWGTSVNAATEASTAQFNAWAERESALRAGSSGNPGAVRETAGMWSDSMTTAESKWSMFRRVGVAVRGAARAGSVAFDYGVLGEWTNLDEMGMGARLAGEGTKEAVVAGVDTAGRRMGGSGGGRGFVGGAGAAGGAGGGGFIAGIEGWGGWGRAGRAAGRFGVGVAVGLAAYDVRQGVKKRGDIFSVANIGGATVETATKFADAQLDALDPFGAMIKGLKTGVGFVSKSWAAKIPDVGVRDLLGLGNRMVGGKETQFSLHDTIYGKSNALGSSYRTRVQTVTAELAAAGVKAPSWMGENEAADWMHAKVTLEVRKDATRRDEIAKRVAGGMSVEKATWQVNDEDRQRVQAEKDGPQPPAWMGPRARDDWWRTKRAANERLQHIRDDAADRIAGMNQAQRDVFTEPPFKMSKERLAEERKLAKEWKAENAGFAAAWKWQKDDQAAIARERKAETRRWVASNRRQVDYEGDSDDLAYADQRDRLREGAAVRRMREGRSGGNSNLGLSRDGGPDFGGGGLNGRALGMGMGAEAPSMEDMQRAIEAATTFN